MENIKFLTPNLQIIQSPSLTIIDECLISISKGLFSLVNPHKTQQIANISKEITPKTQLRIPHIQKKSEKRNILYILITVEGQIFVEEYEPLSTFTFNILYVFNRTSPKIQFLNEIVGIYDNQMLFFQGEFEFESESMKNSYFFEIPSDVTTEIDIVSFQSRKSKENHWRLVVHESGIIQVKPQVNSFLNCWFVSKKLVKAKEIPQVEKPEENGEKFIINEKDEEIFEVLQKDCVIVKNTVKSYIIKGSLVIIQGLIEFEMGKENRVLGKINEKFKPKQDLGFVVSLKEYWDYSIVHIESETGNVIAEKGKAIWVNIIYFI